MDVSPSLGSSIPLWSWNSRRFIQDDSGFLTGTRTGCKRVLELRLAFCLLRSP
jgi:hypothetical protein